ncbi:alanine racemase, partial [Klebsiella pneumoniae]|nr:alanine racemase [Klebsiella pneumoniae]
MSCIPDEIDTPDVLIDRDILDRNIGRMSSAVAAKGIALRPHVKTHKLPEIAHMQLRAGARPDGGHHRGSRGIRRPRRRRRIHHLPIV